MAKTKAVVAVMATGVYNTNSNRGGGGNGSDNHQWTVQRQRDGNAKVKRTSATMATAMEGVTVATAMMATAMEGAMATATV